MVHAVPEQPLALLGLQGGDEGLCFRKRLERLVLVLVAFTAYSHKPTAVSLVDDGFEPLPSLRISFAAECKYALERRASGVGRRATVTTKVLAPTGN